MNLRNLSASLLVFLAVACGAPAIDDSSSGDAELTSRIRPPVLPAAGSDAPWGGTDAARWRPEAVLANAASAALNDAWRDPETRDAIVAVPVAMLGSNVFPYGDGQSNAAPSFNGWPAERPPVVATWIKTASAVKVVVRLDRALPTTAAKVKIQLRGAASLDVPLEVEPTGDRIARFAPPADVAFEDPRSPAPFAVVPDGWRAGLAVSFLHPTKDAASLGVARLLDREGVSSADEPDAAPGTVDARLRTRSFASRYNNHAPGPVAPYANAEVHATFPASGRMVRTGAGGGRTWVFDERPDGYKTMYQCFDGRDAAAEAASADGGVPSATGWHSIGDRAETAVNDLERAPILVGFATHDVLSPNELGPDGFAWNLSAVATVRWLMPGEALVTPRGSFHWFAFAHAAPACAEILVSPEHASLTGFEP